MSWLTLSLLAVLSFAVPQDPPLAELVLYDDAFQNGFGANSWNTPPPNPLYAASVYAGTHSLQKNLFINGGSGEFMAIHRSAGFNTIDYNHIDFYATSLSPEGAFIRVRFATAPWDGTAEEVALTILSGAWTHFVIPFQNFGGAVLNTQFEGIAFSGGGPGSSPNDDDNSVAFDNIRLIQLPDTAPPQVLSATAVGLNVVRVTFSEPVDPASATIAAHYAVSGQLPTSVALAPGGSRVDLTLGFSFADGAPYTLDVSSVADLSGNAVPPGTQIAFMADLLQVDIAINASEVVYPFNPMVRGVAMNNWNWLWGDIMDVNSPKRLGLIEATRYLKPGIIRFAGGLWVNGVGWDRNHVAPDDGPWTDPATGKQYVHAYKPELIDSYAAFAAAVGAETMVQVNIVDNNPAMWADMVRYCNIEKGYHFKYWELGNENAYETYIPGMGPEYAERFAAYQAAMKAVDPTIRLIGPVNGVTHKESWMDPLMARLNGQLDVLSWHWYQLTEWTSDSTTWAYQGGSVEALFSYNHTVGTACLGGWGCPGDLVPFSALNLMAYRRGIAEAMKQAVVDPYRQQNPQMEVAITEFGPHAGLHTHPINGNHVAAIWLADILARHAYNGTDIITYYSLEDGGRGQGNSRGLVGTEDPRYLDVRPIYFTEFLYAQFFGDRMVRSTTDHPDQKVLAWASKDTAEPGSLKLMMVNLTGEVAISTVNVAGFSPAVGYAYEMTSTDPLSMDNPRSFTEHQTTINGFVIPDYDTQNPSVWQTAVASIASTLVEVSGSFTIALPPYSTVALVLKDSPTAPPPQVGTNPPVPPIPTVPVSAPPSRSESRCGMLGAEVLVLVAILAWLGGRR
ncbi:MAG: Ig-like domain-containing protein [Planctomycetes bacterium]|nr:Ig-like domain-containing protein [Planctomycetota bacterium]